MVKGRGGRGININIYIYIYIFANSVTQRDVVFHLGEGSEGVGDHGLSLFQLYVGELTITVIRLVIGLIRLALYKESHPSNMPNQFSR
jgi:hypothetical protein